LFAKYAAEPPPGPGFETLSLPIPLPPAPIIVTVIEVTPAGTVHVPEPAVNVTVLALTGVIKT
jgi:hypothetical protein